MRYIETAAEGPARQFVQAFWQSTGTAPSAATYRVLPDACVDFLFDLADPTRPTHDCAAIIGTMTRAIVVPASGSRDLFGIRFRPAAASLLWQLPMRELCDDRTALDDAVLNGSRLAERLHATDDFHDRVAIAEAWLEKRLCSAEIDRRELERITAVNTRLEQGASIGALTDLTGWNERRLQRFFDTRYGTTAATMRCFWRFEAVRRALTRGAPPNLSALAFAHGYADQAHMTRDFRRFAGVNIGAWRAEQAAA